MSTLLALRSLVKQVAGLVPSPSERRRRDAKADASPSGEGYGLCPHCRDFVLVRFPIPGASAPCPSCGRPIDALEPLGSA